jgi:hypothetical protein
MKRTWIYLIALIFLSACNGIKTVNSDMEEEQLGCENDIAKAILWVDWKRGEDLSGYGSVRTVKVHANVYSDGTFRIMSFCKKQEPKVVEYLKKRVAVYVIPKFFFDEGYIEPGEQYLQLRYLPGKISKD